MENESKKMVEVEAPVEEKNVIVNRINEDKSKEGPSEVKVSKHGKGKILLTIDKVLIGVATVFEVLREVPGFEYLKAMTTGNLVTKFNNWIASISAVRPNLQGLTPEEIFELGKDTALAASNASANGLGLVFSAVLEFILTHPTATVLGISGIIYGLAKAFKFMVRKLGEHEVKKHEKNMSKVR